MGIQEYLEEATRRGASDLFIVAGLPLTYKINRGHLPNCTGKKDRDVGGCRR